jgi:tetratricopeptide (TPR) repeat protein
MTTMQRITTLVAALVCSSAAALPCLWDRDTLRFEAQGLPGMVETITGRFEREPDRFYEVRLERVAREVAAEPGRLELYDDAGVACDRLHRGDEAVAWMERKFAVLEGLAESPSKAEALYRYHANLGTFLAHRWLRGGADRGALEDLQAGREHIRRALELNPDAHFGRERYQEYALTWLSLLPERVDDVEGFDEPTRTLLDACPPDVRPLPMGYRRPGPNGVNATAAAATEALAGLIVLGDAWQSIDVFNALSYALDYQRHSSVGLLAALRAREIALTGRRSLHPEFAAEDPVLAERVASFQNNFEDSGPVAAVESFFAEARAEAEEWHADRAAFVLRRLDEGRHPDTDPDFWSGYSSSPPPTPPGVLAYGLKGDDPQFWTIAVLVCLSVGYGAVIVKRIVRRARSRRAA